MRERLTVVDLSMCNAWMLCIARVPFFEKRVDFYFFELVGIQQFPPRRACGPYVFANYVDLYGLYGPHSFYNLEHI